MDNYPLINQESFVPDNVTDVFEMCEWNNREVEIKGTNGEIIFKQSVEAPDFWSDQTVQIVASKYLYGDQELGDNPSLGGRESSIKQLLWRVANTIAHSGLDQGYFTVGSGEMEEFRNELLFLLLFQYASFNSPVWFNVGLNHEYGITETGGKKLFGWIPDVIDTGAGYEGIVDSVDPYQRPQASACFIISVEDSIDGIWQLMSESARLFKYGSGVGADWSTLRSSREKISGGGIPSGPVSFMKVQDATGGTIKSGGKTRRAAIMQTLKVHHPDIMEFVCAKAHEEKKAHALIEEGYDGSFNGPAYGSVAFQNVNQSVRVTDEFMETLTEKSNPDNPDRLYELRDRNGDRLDTVSAQDVMFKVAEGTHLCGDPGVQYEDTIQEWHTCPNDGPINSSNPCSEYMFLDNSACNLASINLIKFLNVDGTVDFEKLERVSRIFITAMDILVDLSAYPSELIAENSHKYRPLGLGFANLGGLLMSMGIAYDSKNGRALAGGLMAIIHAAAYHQSSVVASRMGPFKGYEENKGPMKEVIKKHRSAFVDSGLYDLLPYQVYDHALDLFNKAVGGGARSGYRNSQVTVLAPTGTIAFMMGCDTTGIEPLLGLVQYKKLAGKTDSIIKITSKTVSRGLRALGYGADKIKEIEEYIETHETLEGCLALKTIHLSVFETSFGSYNTLSWKAHLEMMAACQPFISGAISKTINMPESATVQDIEDAYIMGWELGLKAVAIYRDGSKRSQPVNVKKKQNFFDHAEKLLENTDLGGDGEVRNLEEAVRVVEVFRPLRKKLPDERPSVTHKFTVGGVEGYIHVGLYPDTLKPGEIFITVSKQGSTMSGLLDAFATSVSLNLQWGVPLQDMVTKFTHTRFEPSGFTSNSEIRQCTSIIDYIFKWLSGRDYKPIPSGGIPFDDGMPPDDILDVDEVFVDAVNTGKVLELKVTKDVTPAYDAPPCSVCGTITVRAGSCHTCPSCGTSTGCG